MFDQITLPNGLRVVGEKLGHIHSCTVGVWVKVGSVNELPEENGLSHFIEHMVFKGTENRTARQIAEEMDMVGGQLNAFTSKECTCFYAKVIDEDLRLAVDILSDLALRPTFDEKELNKERAWCWKKSPWWTIRRRTWFMNCWPKPNLTVRSACPSLDPGSVSPPILGRIC